jgi:hypothetical protein
VRQDTYTLPFEWTSSAAHDEFVMQLWEMTRGGADPCWIVPLDDESDILFGRLERSFGDSRTHVARWASHGLRIVEEPHVRWAGLS